MAKKTGRGKGHARKPISPKPKLDDDLTELASVIAEYEFDGGVRGWLRPPWRDGWNAAALAFDLHTIKDVPNELKELHYKILDRTIRSSDYFFAEELLTQNPAPLLRAALRCFQVRLSHNSSGDGSIYNAIMVAPFEKLLADPSPFGDEINFLGTVEDHVIHWRCLDAIGTTPDLRGDINDRVRRAFSIAWKRKLFIAAYSLPPAIKPLGINE